MNRVFMNANEPRKELTCMHYHITVSTNVRSIQVWNSERSQVPTGTYSHSNYNIQIFKKPAIAASIDFVSNVNITID